MSITILPIDVYKRQAYTLKRNRNSGNDFGQEVIDTLVKLMDQYKGKFIVVAAGYPREMELFEKSNPGLAGRFRHLHINDYTPAEREQMCIRDSQKGEGFGGLLFGAVPHFKCGKAPPGGSGLPGRPAPGGTVSQNGGGAAQAQQDPDEIPPSL